MDLVTTFPQLETRARIFGFNLGVLAKGNSMPWVVWGSSYRIKVEKNYNKTYIQTRIYFVNR